jgi:Na+/proline symporter
MAHTCVFARRICWFAIPFSLATSLGLASTALFLPINSAEAGAGLVPPAVATELLGDAGAALILVMLFMAIVSTGSAESIAVSSLIAYDGKNDWRVLLPHHLVPSLTLSSSPLPSSLPPVLQS